MKELTYYKERLETERQRLEEELARVGRKNPDVPGDWEPTPSEMNNDSADTNVSADAVEEFHTRGAVQEELEVQLEHVRAALARIADGSYGTCEVDGESHDIEEDRLEANPAAKTCKAHMN